MRITFLAEGLGRPFLRQLLVSKLPLNFPLWENRQLFPLQETKSNPRQYKPEVNGFESCIQRFVNRACSDTD